MRGSSEDTLVVSSIVRLLCYVRLVTIVLGLIAVITTSDTPWLPSMFVVLFALPLSYFPARHWSSMGEKFSTSGILLACDMACTAIIIAINGGNQFIYLYAIATAALYGVILPAILALGMSAVVGMAFLAAAPFNEVGTHWAIIATVAAVIPIFTLAGNALGRGLRSNAAARRRMLTLEQEEIKFKERTRIARDIHDTVAGDLAGTLMLTATLQAKLVQQGVDDRTLAIAAEIEKACQAAHTDTRAALSELREADAALHEKLRALCAEWSQKFEIEMQADIDDAVDLPASVDNDLYFIARELLENVRKHARASRVHVRAAQQRGEYVLTIADDGVGGVCENEASGFGLRGIRERLGEHSGQLLLESTRESGTRVRVEIPISEVNSK